MTDGLVVLYDFGEGSGGTVRDVGGFGERLDLYILDSVRAYSGFRTPMACASSDRGRRSRAEAPPAKSTTH